MTMMTMMTLITAMMLVIMLEEKCLADTTVKELILTSQIFQLQCKANDLMHVGKPQENTTSGNSSDVCKVHTGSKRSWHKDEKLCSISIRQVL